MNEDYEWLSKGILDYVRENTGDLDSVDIVAHFKIRGDITMMEIKKLEEAGKISREWDGAKYAYWHTDWPVK